MHGTARKLLFTAAFFASAHCVADEPDAPAFTQRSDAWTTSFSELRFRDETTLDRLSRLRNLSLLTLAETRKARLFLGVNDDGLVGLHFTHRRRREDDRFLELARLR